MLKPQRSEGGHRQFDEEDIQRIEEIKRWIKSGVSVSKVKVLLEQGTVETDDDWTTLQEEMMGVLRFAHPAVLRAKIGALAREHTSGDLIDHVFVPVRQRLSLDHNTARIMCSLLDGVLIEFVTACMSEARKKPAKMRC